MTEEYAIIVPATKELILIKATPSNHLILMANQKTKGGSTYENKDYR